MSEQVRELRQRGATVIVIAGHSTGANAAIACAAYGSEKVDGIIAIAPGHTPDRVESRQAIKADLDGAREMIRAGKGGDHALFLDRNQGREEISDMTASISFSCSDPVGVASMPLSASKVRLGLPLFG
ncbi:MAG: hypothetical protein WCH05_09005 [Chlorobiaceae bacterium]